MLVKGILNPELLHLLARFRHTNTLVIADRGFPSWPEVETLDLSVVDGLPTVLDILNAIKPHLTLGQAYMAREFRLFNDPETRAQFAKSLGATKLTHEPHVTLKKRVPGCIGLIRTGDTVPYANMVLVSG